MKSQTDRLYELLSDFSPHRVDEIVEKVYGYSGDQRTVARVGARAWDVKKKFKVEIDSWKDLRSKTLWVYQMKKNLDERSLFD